MDETVRPLFGDTVFPSGDVTQLWAWWQQNMPITVNYMESGSREKELAIIRDVASYGRQLGRITEALGVLVERAERAGLTGEQIAALEDFADMTAEIAAVKSGYRAPTKKTLYGMASAIRYWKRFDPVCFRQARARLLRELEED